MWVAGLSLCNKADAGLFEVMGRWRVESGGDRVESLPSLDRRTHVMVQSVSVVQRREVARTRSGGRS